MERHGAWHYVDQTVDGRRLGVNRSSARTSCPPPLADPRSPISDRSYAPALAGSSGGRRPSAPSMPGARRRGGNRTEIHDPAHPRLATMSLTPGGTTCPPPWLRGKRLAAAAARLRLVPGARWPGFVSRLVARVPEIAMRQAYPDGDVSPGRIDPDFRERARRIAGSAWSPPGAASPVCSMGCWATFHVKRKGGCRRSDGYRHASSSRPIAPKMPLCGDSTSSPTFSNAAAARRPDSSTPLAWGLRPGRLPASRAHGGRPLLPPVPRCRRPARRRHGDRCPGRIPTSPCTPGRKFPASPWISTSAISARTTATGHVPCSPTPSATFDPQRVETREVTRGELAQPSTRRQ